jgi:hypothetical protein
MQSLSLKHEHCLRISLPAHDSAVFQILEYELHLSMLVAEFMIACCADWRNSHSEEGQKWDFLCLRLSDSPREGQVHQCRM